jgi:formylglycine-generating enzyme required for sulfatase activity
MAFRATQHTGFGATIAILVLAGICDAQQQPKHSLTYLLEDKGAFVRIPAGQFSMGSTAGNPDEAPVHRVRISKPYEIGRYEVTQAQWKAVMEDPHAKPATPEEADSIEPSRFKGAELPVESVTWYSVQRFLGALNARDKRYVYRLPTEAEWEYAAGNGAEGGWCQSNSGASTHPIGEKPPNKFGLNDTVGNVMEWVQDWYAPEYYGESPSTDPKGPGTGSYKVYRGGAWLSEAKQCRPTYRGFDLPNNTHDSVGFRLVRTRR